MSFLRDLCGHYEEEQPDWPGVTLLEIIYAALATLAHYVQDARDDDVTWESPFVSAQYEVELDWDALKSRGEVSQRLGTVTSEDLQDSHRVARKVVDTFISHRNQYVLGAVTNRVVILRDKGEEIYVFPQRVLKEAQRLGRTRGRRFLLALCEPFCLGTTLLSDRETTPGRAVSKTVARRLRKVMTSPRLTFTLRLGRRRIAGSIVVVVNPLTVDVDRRRAFYPVTIGIAFDGGRAPRLERKVQGIFWRELLQDLADEITEASTWDPAFMGKATVWERDTPRGKRRSRDLLALADGRRSLESFGHRDFEELLAELYAGLGYRVRLTRCSRDGGRDLILEKDGPVAIRVLVECKRPERGNKVEVLPVRALYGVQEDEEASKAVLVTTTGFTPEGEAMAARHKWRIEMVDRRRLMRLISQYRSIVEVEHGARERRSRRSQGVTVKWVR